jgi:PIN domain nuclease of toxin-antitoxin system
MKILLDTHVVVWAAVSPRRLSARAVAAIQDERSELLISAATAWEIATKVRIGKLPEAEKLERNLVELATAAEYTFLPISFESALRSGRMIASHGDPFDRMIAAQALELDLDLISIDTKLDQFGVRRIW